MLTQTLIVSCALQVAQSAADNEPVIVRAEDADWSSYFQLAAIYIRHLSVSDGKHTANVIQSLTLTFTHIKSIQAKTLQNSSRTI